ncbi:MAG: hypothetical protein AMJ81_10220 [Phycisphaerae bacterium SM23_33]|nr:MAG: hypothetical protein AMJ81_10220 [Phycisphaerae bacterium SM23_33]
MLIALMLLPVAAVGCGGTAGRTGSKNKPLLTQPQAEQVVMEVPEVAAWARAVKARSRGRVIPVCKAEHTPSDPPIEGRRVWILCFSELDDRQTVLWNRFEVDAVTGQVRVWQPASDSYVPLLEWRKKVALETGAPFPSE